MRIEINSRDYKRGTLQSSLLVERDGEQEALSSEPWFVLVSPRTHQPKALICCGKEFKESGQTALRSLEAPWEAVEEVLGTS